MKNLSMKWRHPFFRKTKVLSENQFSKSLLILMLVGSVAMAQRTQEKKKTAVNFEDQLIQGELNKPEFFYFLQRKQFNFGRLIKFRENFLLEMRKTTEQIERKGSGI